MWPLDHRLEVRILSGWVRHKTPGQTGKARTSKEVLAAFLGPEMLRVCSPVQDGCRWGGPRRALPGRDPVGVPRALSDQGQPRHQPSHHTPELTTGETPLSTCTVSNDTVNTVASSFL